MDDDDDEQHPPLCCCVCYDEESNEPFVISMNCMHGVCRSCYQHLKDKSCVQCKGKFDNVVYDVPPNVFNILSDRSYTAATTTYDALFSPKLETSYKCLRGLIRARWSSVQGYTLSPVCNICVAIAKYKLHDFQLFNLYYACAPLTKNVIEDALATLYIRYGTAVCSNITPKDIFFHFFLNMCDLRKMETLPGYQAENFGFASDRIIVALHDLLYDIADVDELYKTFSSFVMSADITSDCGCNNVKKHVKLITEQAESTKSKTEEDGGGGESFMFIPDDMGEDDDDIQGRGGETTFQYNNYRWQRDLVLSEPSLPEVLQAAAGDNEDDNKEPPKEVVVDCWSVYHTCQVCTDMMIGDSLANNKKIEQSILHLMKFQNIETAVQVTSNKFNLTASETEELLNHYTNPRCELNRVKTIPFHSLVKDPLTLENQVFVRHLYEELFANKSASVCPMYYLAVLCDEIVKADPSDKKKTKRDNIEKKAAIISRRHVIADLKNK